MENEELPNDTPANPPHAAPPSPGRKSKTVHIYRLDETTKLPIIVGLVFIDTMGAAWVRIDAEELAAGIGVENVNGVALLDHQTYVGMVD